MQQKDVEVLWRDFLLQDFCLLTHITLLPVTHITGPTSKDERPETSQTVSLPPSRRRNRRSVVSLDLSYPEPFRVTGPLQSLVLRADGNPLGWLARRRIASGRGFGRSN